MGARSSEVRTGWKMLTSPPPFFSKDLRSFKLRKLFRINTFSYKSQFQFFTVLLRFPFVKLSMGIIQMELSKQLSELSEKASSYIKVRMKAGSKEICNKFLLSQTINFHTKLHNTFSIIFPITKSCP